MDAGLYKRTDNFRAAAEKLLLHGLIGSMNPKNLFI